MVKKKAVTGRPVANPHKVPKKQWSKWSPASQRLFNGMMYSLRPSMQFAFLHPDCPPMAKEHWQTTRWNAAWMAAEFAKKGVLKKVVIVDDKAKRRG